MKLCTQHTQHNTHTHQQELDLRFCRRVGDAGLLALVRAHGVNRKLWKRHQLLAASHLHTASAADGEEEEEADDDDTAAAAAAASAAQCHSRLHTLLLAECSLLSARALSLLSTIPSLVRAHETRTRRAS